MLPKDRLIVALDVSSTAEVERLVDQLGDHVGMFKIGLELAAAVGWPAAIEAVQRSGARVFADAKLHDIPQTVARAARELSRHAVGMFNVHCSGGPAMMKAAMEAAREAAVSGVMERPRVIGVTLLTSLSHKDLFEVGLLGDDGAGVGSAELQAIVVSMAMAAKDAGLDGVIASPNEAQALRVRCGGDFEIITPGVRPTWATAKDDQKRVLTPSGAIRAGATRLVVGRPITQPPAGITSVVAAQRIVEEIASVV